MACRSAGLDVFGSAILPPYNYRRLRTSTLLLNFPPLLTRSAIHPKTRPNAPGITLYSVKLQNPESVAQAPRHFHQTHLRLISGKGRISFLFLSLFAISPLFRCGVVWCVLKSLVGSISSWTWTSTSTCSCLLDLARKEGFIELLPCQSAALVSGCHLYRRQFLRPCRLSLPICLRLLVTESGFLRFHGLLRHSRRCLGKEHWISHPSDGLLRCNRLVLRLRMPQLLRCL